MGRLVTRAELLAEARRWIDTPVVWQQCTRGRGVDCKGLPAGVARELGLDEANSLAARARKYLPGFDPKQLVAGLDETLIRTTAPGPADVVGLIINLPRSAGPRHVAMLSDKPGWVIHAYGRGIERVCEVPISGEVWGYWTWPSLVPEDRLG